MANEQEADLKKPTNSQKKRIDDNKQRGKKREGKKKNERRTKSIE